MPVPHCPHCLLPMLGAKSLPYPPAPIRCPQCRLIIGPGRARGEATEDGDARSRGSAAGVLANAARRANSEPGVHADVIAALVLTAAEVGCAVERLRMLDYQAQAERAPDRPDLATVLATYSTWKAARAAAAAVMPPAVTQEDVAQTG